MQVSNPSTQTCDNFFIAHADQFGFRLTSGRVFKWPPPFLQSILKLTCLPQSLNYNLSPPPTQFPSAFHYTTDIIDCTLVSFSFYVLHSQISQTQQCITPLPPQKNWWFHPVLHSSLFISLSFPPHPHHLWKLWICWLLWFMIDKITHIYSLSRLHSRSLKPWHAGWNFRIAVIETLEKKFLHHKNIYVYLWQNKKDVSTFEKESTWQQMEQLLQKVSWKERSGPTWGTWIWVKTPFFMRLWTTSGLSHARCFQNLQESQTQNKNHCWHYWRGSEAAEKL